MNKQILRFIVLTGLFLVPFIPFLVSSSFFFPFITTKAFAWRILVEIIFATWLLLALADTEYRPKKSPLLYAVGGFLLVIGLANLLGDDPTRSFWSNFERMEGYISLLHLGAFFLVIGSVFKTVEWKRWWNTSLVASGIMVLYCLFQIGGVITINQGGVRVDGTFGNAIYLAVYMLFHTFMAALYLWRANKNSALKWAYGLLILGQMFILYYTATRGAILALLGGFLIMALLNLRNKEDPRVRKWSIGILVTLVVMVGAFLALKNTALVTQSPVLSRFSSLTIEELKSQGRYFVWPIALEGVKEKPLLGWGQENFTYVFQKHYSPEMYHLEPWFDRAHNIFLDWAVAGGLLGLLFYLYFYGALLYLIWFRGNDFSYTEKSILTGLIAAYFFHNFFVFDHLVSYILFFSLLAHVHSNTAEKPVWEKSLSESQVKTLGLPAVILLLIFSLYTLNYKPLQSNLTLIKSLKALQTPGDTSRVAPLFKEAYASSVLGRPEVVEQMSGNAVTFLQSDASTEEKNQYFLITKETLLAEADKSSRNARTQIVAGSFLSTTGLLDEALVYLKRAKELIPGKQQVYFELGSAYLNKKEPALAMVAFKEAYEMVPTYYEAKMIYLIGAIYTGDRELERKLLSEIPERTAVFEDRLISAYYTSSRLAEVSVILERRIQLDPANTATYEQYLEQVRSEQ